MGDDHLADGLIAAIGWCVKKLPDGSDCGGLLVFRTKKPIDKSR